MFSSVEEAEKSELPDSENSESTTGLWTKLWVGKDYTNFIVKDFSQLDKPMIGAFQFPLSAL